MLIGCPGLSGNSMVMFIVVEVRATIELMLCSDNHHVGRGGGGRGGIGGGW